MGHYSHYMEHMGYAPTINAVFDWHPISSASHAKSQNILKGRRQACRWKDWLSSTGGNVDTTLWDSLTAIQGMICEIDGAPYNQVSLVGGIPTILKNMKVNGKDYPIYEMGKIVWNQQPNHYLTIGRVHRAWRMVSRHLPLISCLGEMDFQRWSWRNAGFHKWGYPNSWMV